MKRLILLLLLPLLACSETPEEEIIPSVSIRTWSSGTKIFGESPPRLFRVVTLDLESNIPMPADTYVLLHHEHRVNDNRTPYRFVLICEGHTTSQQVFYYSVCLTEGPLTTLEPEIRPMHERAALLPHDGDTFELPVGYRFNPYHVGDPASVRFKRPWCP